ncbi:MAG: ABC transporter ATP-binding protein [Lachnospiraceae bacterium]|nr:ABC transporter ATP-binding protein [Lachnospiraceae bacterium]
MISLRGVSKTYDKKGVRAVDNLNMDIADGKITGFIGPNGAGKTTTLKIITGILEPDEGTVTIDGLDMRTQPLEAKKRFGFVADSPDSFLRLKGLEYLHFCASIYGVDPAVEKSKIADMAQRFDMQKALSDKISNYSHGMRQKIMVMGALLHDPNVWILDEPLTGLDPKAAFELKEMMREHAAAGRSVLFSTHVLEVAEKLCDQVIIINKGRIIFLGTLDMLREQYPAQENLEDIFLELISHA